MQNKDMPAMPQSVAYGPDGGVIASYHFADGQGLTKREMFAMHAPDVPEWFRAEFSNREGNFGFFDAEIEMQLLREWRYAYADAMLGDD